MAPGSPVDVSVILPFADHEEVIGSAVRRLATHLRAFELTFEVVAVDCGAVDNSRAVLALVRNDVSDISVVDADNRERIMAPAARVARGRILWILDVDSALAPLAPFARAHRQVASGARDIVAVEGRFTLCYRSRCVDAIQTARGLGARFQRSLFRRARPRRLATELVRVNSMGRAKTVDDRPPLSRLVDALLAARSAWTGPR